MMSSASQDTKEDAVDYQEEIAAFVESSLKLIKSKSKKERSLLRAAVKGNDKKIVELLSKKGLDMNCKDIERGESPLHYAASVGNHTTLDYLLTKGADPKIANPKGRTPLHKATYYNHINIIRTLVSHGADVNAKDEDGMTCLFLSIQRNNGSAFATLIECGANFKEESKTGAIPLIEAASRGFTKGVKAICEKCRDTPYLNVTNTGGNTALHVASLNGRTGVIAALMGFRPDVTIRNIAGFTASELATTSGFHDIANVIKKAHEFKPIMEQTYERKNTLKGRRDIPKSKQGYLQIYDKKKKKWFQNWFELRDHMLFRFEKAGGRQIELFNLLGAKSSVSFQEQKLPQCFQVVLPTTGKKSANNTFILRAETMESMHEWMDGVLESSKKDAGGNPTKSFKLDDFDTCLEQATVGGENWDQFEKNLEHHINQKKFEQEWIMLEQRELAKDENLCSDASLEVNRMKNRYLNILPNNATRVRLPVDGNSPPGADFINANYVNAGARWFIGTQAPLPHTMFDFYHMLWYNNTGVVIMLTKFEEAGKLKADNYIPLEGPVQVGELIVELVSEEKHPNYVLRRLNLWRNTEMRPLLQFHYTAWPDHGVTDTDSLLETMEAVNQALEDVNPVVVHCSAGIGRTGTWMAIRAVLDDLEEIIQRNIPPEINLMNTLDLLRSQRNGMVTGVEQYEFCYRTVHAHVKKLIATRPELVRSRIPQGIPPPPADDIPPPPPDDIPPPPPDYLMPSPPGTPQYPRHDAMSPIGFGGQAPSQGFAQMSLNAAPKKEYASLPAVPNDLPLAPAAYLPPPPPPDTFSSLPPPPPTTFPPSASTLPPPPPSTFPTMTTTPHAPATYGQLPTPDMQMQYQQQFAQYPPPPSQLGVFGIPSNQFAPRQHVPSEYGQLPKAQFQ